MCGKNTIFISKINYINRQSSKANGQFTFSPNSEDLGRAMAPWLPPSRHEEKDVLIILEPKRSVRTGTALGCGLPILQKWVLGWVNICKYHMELWILGCGGKLCCIMLHICTYHINFPIQSRELTHVS